MKENRKPYYNNSEKDIEAAQPIRCIGIVSDCKYLNVRSQPDKSSNPVHVLEAGAAVEIDTLNSSDEFYKVFIPNEVEGYCMKNFIHLT